MFNYSTLNEALETVKQSDRSITFIESKLDNRVLSYAQLYKNGLSKLYDLQQDPHERSNIYMLPQNKEIISKLKEKLAQLRIEFGDDDG